MGKAGETEDVITSSDRIIDNLSEYVRKRRKLELVQQQAEIRALRALYILACYRKKNPDNGALVVPNNNHNHNPFRRNNRPFERIEV